MRWTRRAAWILVVASAAGGACAKNEDVPADDSSVPAPDRKDSGGSKDGAQGTDGGGSPSSDSEPDDAFVPKTCGTMNGLFVICMRQGETFEAFASVTYGPGFPDGLPAMGLGKTQLGYLPGDYPFTCIAKGELLSKSVNNTAGGKICEVVFDNKVTGTVKGTATYTIKIDIGAKLGIYDVAYLANTGATPEVPGFYVKVEP